MSTPIETNTEQLQEVLQQVYNLPNRSGGGSVTPDLVVVVDGISSDHCVLDLCSDDVSIESGSVENTIAKMVNGGYANVLVKLSYIYGYEYYMQFVPENVRAIKTYDDYLLTIAFGPMPHYSQIDNSKVDLFEIELWRDGNCYLTHIFYKTSVNGENLELGVARVEM